MSISTDSDPLAVDRPDDVRRVRDVLRGKWCRFGFPAEENGVGSAMKIPITRRPGGVRA